MYAGPHDGPVYQQGAVITAICDPGYLLNGPAERECIADGVWSGINSTCNLGQLNDACFYPNFSHCLCLYKILCRKALHEQYVCSSCRTSIVLPLPFQGVKDNQKLSFWQHVPRICLISVYTGAQFALHLLVTFRATPTCRIVLLFCLSLSNLVAQTPVTAPLRIFLPCHSFAQ